MHPSGLFFIELTIPYLFIISFLLFFTDPEDMPGLAHFLEHMLFLGTETYPTENAYSSYLNAHGGHSNAYTDQEDTVYYFDVLNQGFDEALNMFSSFFTCPLFTESATARETNAVDSENQKNLQVSNLLPCLSILFLSSSFPPSLCSCCCFTLLRPTE